MAKFLNTSETTFRLEELIRTARERLILISPYLKLNDRLKELLEDKNRFKLDVRIIYGKSDLQPAEANWIKALDYVRTSFCKNLHAKCYLNENACIITSMNLYDFSQVNNNEMGVFIERAADPELYRDAFDEAQRIDRFSEEVRISLEKVNDEGKTSEKPVEKLPTNNADSDSTPAPVTLTSSKLAKKLGMKTGELLDKLVALGYLELRDEKQYLTDKGKTAGGEFRLSKRFGPFFIWPQDFAPE